MALLFGIVKVVEDGVTLLGAPLGSGAFVGREPQRKVEKVREISEIFPFNSCTVARCRPIGDLIAHIGHLPTSQGLLHIGIINSIELVSSSARVTCISKKFGNQLTPLALVRNLATRWRHMHCHIAWDYLIGIIYHQLVEGDQEQLYFIISI